MIFAPNQLNPWHMSDVIIKTTASESGVAKSVKFILSFKVRLVMLIISCPSRMMSAFLKFLNVE